MIIRTLLALVTVVVLSAVIAVAAPPGSSQVDTTGMAAAIDDLESKIGGFPPNIASEGEQAEVEGQYQALEKKINAAIKSDPDDAELLFQRGKLHVMGHNLGIPGAWKQAETDLLEVIRRRPDHEGALLQLGNHYVNTSPDLAPRAERLFLEAQRIHGNEPLLAARKGLIFAYYYQGRIREALQQAETAVKLAPTDKGLARQKEIIESKLKEE
jgi:tetratricopeptide (TPR) repeat protein